MTDTWSVFSGSDLFLGLLGAAGLLSMIVVVATASQRVGKREVVLSQARRLQNLEPEEQVLEDLDPDFIPDNYYGDGDHYETSGK